MSELNLTDGAILFNNPVVFTGNLTGEVTSVGMATTVTNAAVIGKVITGYVSGAGTVAATDTILQAINKLNGNTATKMDAIISSLVVGTGSTTTGQITFKNATNNNNQIIQGTAMAGNIVYQLPITAPVTGQLLSATTPGGGVSVMTWETIAGGDATRNLGYLNIPQNPQSAAYLTVLADAGKHILHPASDNNARVFTIDSNANVLYPVGTAITFINLINTVTISIATDTLTMMGSGATGSRSLAANGIATAIKVGTTDWVISGTSLS